ncbi:hypothetical protein ZEAMMB73_Zm00001d029643 [Zea mays]|uniref:Uncharacterized protein n=2 Tax=Zea mays TaxID=4577 RepID=A0A1D6K6F1_MAIZE|nr:hypothetical protein ZEAMMB73_Zm00001d029643 [Zea mays]
MIGPTRSMAGSGRINQNRTVPDIHPFPPFVLFDDIQDFNNLPHVKSIFSRVVVKFPRRHDSQHFILQDITGSKMEAISSRNNVPRFDALLTQGCTYTLYRVGFCLNREGIQFRNIGHGLEIGLITHTIVEPFIKPIQFPPFPKYLMPFHKVYQQPHKSFVDIIGIVLHLEPLKHIGGRPYREAVLMDSRWDLIVVGVWTDLLQRNALRWSLARVDNNIIIGTMLRRNNKHRCLETSDYNTVHFNPDHHTTYHLKTIRRSLIQNPRRRIVDKFLENRRAHLTTVISD